MNKRKCAWLVVMLIVAATPAFAQADDDEAAIKEVIDRAYVHGVHLDADPEKMRSGMHESFVMFVRNGEQVTSLTRDAWIARIEAAKAQPKPDTPRPDLTATIDVLDHSGDAAVARVKLFRGDSQIFTDYISLYRFDGNWKMVGKIFRRF